MCVHTVKPEATCIYDKRDMFLWVNAKHFSMFYSFLRELWSRGWFCVSIPDKANERKNKQREGDEGIHQGVCWQPEKAASTGLRAEIKFNIREVCLSIVSKPLRRLKGTGICTWLSTSGREHGADELFMDYLLVLRNFSLFILQERKKGGKKVSHLPFNLERDYLWCCGQSHPDAMAGFGGWGLEAMAGCNTAILFHFLGNLKEDRENLWDKENCLATEKYPIFQILKNYIQLHQVCKELKKGSERYISRAF